MSQNMRGRENAELVMIRASVYVLVHVFARVYTRIAQCLWWCIFSLR